MNKSRIDARLAVLVMLVGAFRFWDVTLIARVPVAEILAFSCLPILLRNISFNQFGSQTRIFISALVIWSISIFISDFANDFVFLRFIRAFNRPLFCFLWMLFFVSVLTKDFRLLNFYIVGLVLASLQNYFYPSSYNELFVKSDGYVAVAVGLVPIVTAVTVAGAVFLGRIHYLLAVLSFFASAAVLLAIGAPRNNAGIMLLVGISLAYLHLFLVSRKGEVRWKSAGVALIGGFFVCLGLYYSYVYAAGNGWLGEYQYSKFMNQQKTVFGSSPIGLMLGGRPQVYGAILGIIERPFIGHGSWTGVLMFDYYLEALSSVTTDSSVVASAMNVGRGGVGHSILFQAWLENGLLSAVALLLIFVQMCREFVCIVCVRTYYIPFFLYTFIAFSWAFLFSPFGVESRIIIGLVIALRIVRLDLMPRRRT